MDKFHFEKGDYMYKKKDMNIQSYEGQDAFYSGTDEEYEEFLKNADIKMNDGEEAEPVENTQRINLNETINIQNVIDKFRKTAGGIGSSARNIKDTVVNKMDMFKSKKDDEPSGSEDEETADEVSEEKEQIAEESGIADKIKNSVKSSVQTSVQKIDEIKEGARSITEMSERFDDVEIKIQNVCDDVSSLAEKLSALSEKMNVYEVQAKERMKEHEQNYSDIKEAVETAGAGISEIKQAVNSVSRLNDSVFDLKNTQLNTKKSVSDLETAFTRLKKKCVLGVTVLSILSAIVIVLEIVLMLS